MRHSRQQLANLRRSASFAAPLSTGHAKFSGADAAQLQAEMLGTVVLASSDDYDHARQDFANNFQSSPQIITYCEVPRDVQVCLEFARTHGLRPVCRSGGHSTAGFSVNDEMILDVSRISYVVVDEAKQTAIVGAGTNFAKLDAILNGYGLHVPGGGCPGVCVAGFMQGGGYGFTSIMYGMNCDSVTGVVVALASGEIVTANASVNPDLFWAMRGGTGNNFGVLLEITYRLYELPEVWGFGLRWPLDSETDLAHAATVLETWQSHYTGAAADRRLGHQGLIVRVEDEPALLIRGMYRGDADECRQALQPLFALHGDPAGPPEIWQGGTYEEINGLLLSYPVELPDVAMNIRGAIDSRIVDRQIDATDWRGVLDFYARTPNTANTVGLEPYGGAINDPAPGATAFYHRRAMLDIFVWSFWMYEEDREEAERYIDEFDRVVTPLSNGHSYQNYPHRRTPHYARRYWGSNYDRLRAVKAKYDPKTLFQFPQMIKPLADSGTKRRPATAPSADRKGDGTTVDPGPTPRTT